MTPNEIGGMKYGQLNNPWIGVELIQKVNPEIFNPVNGLRDVGSLSSSSFTGGDQYLTPSEF